MARDEIQKHRYKKRETERFRMFIGIDSSNQRYSSIYK